MKNSIARILALFLFVIFAGTLPGSAQTAGTGVRGIINSTDTLRSRMPREKLYLHFDKPYYNTADTIRLSAYLFDAAFLSFSKQSGIVYIEMANDSNKVVLRRMLALQYGLGSGNLILNEIVPEGSYTVRAYTSLMRNFGEDLVFKKNFYISSIKSLNWLASSKTEISKDAGKDKARLALQLNEMNRKPLGLHEMDVVVLDDNKVIQRNKVKTDVTGMLDVSFNLPEKTDAKNIALALSDPGVSSYKMMIPVPVNRPENMDLQFMPEGGNLVAGISSVVGFKAVGEDGQATEVSGKVYNSRNEEAASFSSSHKGTGSFAFIPQAGETYTAKVTLQDGTQMNYKLPAIRDSGTVLKVVNPKESDSLEVKISLSAGLTGTYYLIGQSRGIVCYGAVIRSSDIKKISKNVFPTGIARFTLLNADRQPLNERIAYIDHKDNLNINVKPAKASFSLRDSIALDIVVKDHEGRPVQGSFSLAVTDDSQVRMDSLSSNILTSLLLTSDLKGTVEEPGYYFQQAEKAWKDLDNLLLTQGWTGYDWKDIFSPPVTEFAPEPEFTVSGRITNVFNKGVETGIHLLTIKPKSTQHVLAGKDGSFRFAGLPVADSLQFFLQARNKSGKSFNVGVEVDEFKPPVFQASARRFIPWYLNSDTTLLRQISTQAVQEQRLAPKDANMLQNVVISGKKIIKDSKNLNGPGESDQALDEKDLAAVPKKSLLDLMKEKIKGFNYGVWPTSNAPQSGLTSVPTGLTGGRASGTIKATTANLLFNPVMSYRIFDKELHLVIDGIDVEQFYIPSPGTPMPFTKDKDRLNEQFAWDPAGNYILERMHTSATDRKDFIQTFLDNILAEDVTGIEILASPRYNGRYKSEFAWKYGGSLSIVTTDFAFVEVTTRSGNGAFMKKIPGTYLYMPMFYAEAAAFYRPKYKPNSIVTGADLRSTIHWEPFIITDKDGKGSVSFYSADRPGSYTIITEGSDMNGSIGRNKERIIIRN